MSLFNMRHYIWCEIHKSENLMVNYNKRKETRAILSEKTISKNQLNKKI